MSPIQVWTLVFVALTFSVYIYIAWRSRVASTEGFYVAGHGVPAIANGAAVGADWMSAASFISLAGIVAFAGYDGSVYLMGWTGGYVLLAVLLAPYLRKFGKYTVPDFVGDRFSETARAVAALAAIFVSFTYVAGQMRGVGIVFGRFLGVGIVPGVMIGVTVVFFYAVLGGMKGITWTQVAQYTVLIIAYLIPAVAISLQLTGQPFPQIGFGQVAQELNGLQADLGFPEYTKAFTERTMLDTLLVTASLMVGTAGLPHIIVRFYTTKTVRAARASAFWALLFIAILYTTAPAIGVFSKFNLINDVHNTPIEQLPDWVRTWQNAGLIQIEDVNGDGAVQYKPEINQNEIVVDQDIMVLANPEIAGLPAPVVGIVAAGGLAAALSTASGLLLVISSAVAHDFYFKRFRPDSTERQQLIVGRTAMGAAVIISGYFGVYPPAFVAEVVAFAFGLAAASFFPILVLGIFWRRCNAAGATAGILTGLTVTAVYMYWTIFMAGAGFLAISPEGFGFVGALINFAVTVTVSKMTAPPPEEMRELIDNIRYPLTERSVPSG
ncbi:MAG: cation acetate symporter [Actinomycetota bacterium]|nr:cation acetate symporter [Actinomycetota bacterium]